MATRCNVQISDKDTSLWIYRHWDGYPECTRVELEEILKTRHPQSANELGDLLVGEFGSNYRYTEGEHGDIEYLYQIYIGELYYTIHTISIYFYIDENKEYKTTRKHLNTILISYETDKPND